MIRILPLAAGLLAFQPLGAAAQTFPPKDQCAALPGFAAMRAQLARAVRNRDAKALLALVASDIEFSVVADGSKAAFVREWELDTAPARSQLWAELEKILPMGCGLEEQATPVIPYVFVTQPDVDFEPVIPTRPQVNLRAAPGSNAKVVMSLRWHVLMKLADPDDAGWVQVETAAGVKGYVHEYYLQSMYGFRAIFAREGTRWLMVAFVAGD